MCALGLYHRVPTISLCFRGVCAFICSTYRGLYIFQQKILTKTLGNHAKLSFFANRSKKKSLKKRKEKEDDS